jgi:hypothetical protein
MLSTLLPLNELSAEREGEKGRLSSLGIMLQLATGRGYSLLAVRSTMNLRSFLKITAL